MLSYLRINAFSFRFLKPFLIVLMGVSSVFCLPVLKSYAQFEIVIDDKGKEEKEEWERHSSISGIFEVKFPQNYKYKVFPFRFNNKEIAFSVEILSSLDGTAATQDKSILVRAAQTFGGQIQYKKAKQILDQEAARYVASAEKMGGNVLTNEDFVYNDFPGKNIYITYYSDGGKYGIRVRTYMTDYAKVEQVLTGSAQSMFSYRSDDFFDSLRLNDGRISLDEPEEFAKGWTEYTSNNKLFTVKLPPQNADYTPVPPRFAVVPGKEVMRFFFLDPVVNETVFYNVYAYKLKRKINYSTAKRILFSQHVKKYVDNASIENLNTKNTVQDDHNSMIAKLVIAPPPNKPYLSQLHLEMRYAGDVAIVQEIASSANHAITGFPDLLADTVKFYPKNYQEPPASMYNKKTSAKPSAKSK